MTDDTGGQVDDRDHVHTHPQSLIQSQSQAGWLLCLFLLSALRYAMFRGIHSEQPLGLSVKSHSLAFNPQR